MRRRVLLALVAVAASAQFAGSATGRHTPAVVRPSPALGAAATPNAIQIENAKPGTPGWDEFASVGTQDAINGFASKISVNHGDSLDLYVTTTAPSFTIDVYRTGWYGGVGARQVASLGTFPGVHQAIPAPNPVTGMVACTNWTKTTTLTIPSDWVTGVYLARLNASNGRKSFIFFNVRDDGGTEPIAFQTSVTTYQAYNDWGGVSLYTNNTNKSVYRYDLATKVSFDRPFNPYDSNGAGQYLAYEYPFIRWAESQGLDMTYITDVDTHTNVNPLTNHRAFLSVGHDEYWTKGMRDNVTAAIAQGMNAAFFSANSAFWQIRLEPNSAGVPNRVQVGYKDSSTFPQAPGPDPQFGVDNSVVTVHWRDPPVNRPENGLLGVMYQDQVNQSYPYVVQNASNWIYAGTGFVNGSKVPGIVGYEYDKVFNNGASPAGLTVLSSSPVVGCCEGSGSSVSNSTLYTYPGGGQVFAAGTIQWSWGLDNYNASFANAGIQKTTRNILDAFSSGTPGPTPAVSLSPTSLAFGSQRVGTTSATQGVTLTNSGTAALTINSIALGGTNPGDFTQTSTCPVAPSTLAAGANCTISAGFAPTATGSRSANVTVTDNAAGSPRSIGLTGTGTAPAVTLTPTSLAFGSQLLGSTSAVRTSVVKNTGTAPLAISGFQIGGSNPGDFAQTNDCPATLAVNATCTISATFGPTVGGGRSANVAVSDDATGSPQNVALTGTGTAPAPAVALSPASLAFGSQRVGTTSAAQPVTLTNSGTAALTIGGIAAGGDYAQTNDCAATLAASASCTISVTFTPTATGTRNASVSVTDDAAGSPQSVALSGTGAAPAVGLSRTSIGFGPQLLGSTTAAQSATLTNTGTAPLAISSIILAGDNAADFAHSSDCPASPATLAVGASCTISATFTPSATGPRSASVSIGDDASDSPQMIALSGNGVTAAPAVTLSPASLDFASQRVGSMSSVQATTLTNTGSAPLSIGIIGLAGANSGDFAQSSDCPIGPATLAVNASCTISATFTPTAAGSRTANVSITDDAAGSPQSIPLSGIGTAPAVSLTPGALVFGSRLVGTTSAAQSSTLRNTGTAPLAISGLTLAGANPGDFSRTSTCPIAPATLAVNASCTISATFTPTATGSRTASVSIGDDAAGSPHALALSGTGSNTGIAFDKSLGTKSDNAGSTTMTLTTSAAAVSGSRVFLFVDWNQGSRTLTSVSGGGLTWTVDRQAKDGTNYHAAIASAAAPSGLASGTVITATFSGAVIHGLIAAASFTGIASSGSLDVTGSSTQGGVVGWSAGLTSTNANDLVLGMSAIDANATSTAGAPSTEIHDFGDANYFSWATTAYRIESTTGSKTVNGTWSRATGATANVTVVAAYRGG